MSKERTTAFTDAILAIIMTILVLELPEPKVLNWAGLWGLRTSFLSYAISFFWLGIMWIGLHNEWNGIKEVTAGTLWVNMLLLFWSSLFPYTTKLVSANFFNKTAQVFYGIIVILTTLTNIWLSHILSSDPANKAERPASEFRQRWLLIDICVKIIGLIVTIFWWTPAVMVSLFASAIIIAIPAHIKEAKNA